MEVISAFSRSLDAGSLASDAIPMKRGALLALSEVEFLVAVRKAQGYLEREIASELVVATSTVTGHAWKARNVLRCPTQQAVLQLVLAEYAPELWLGRTVRVDQQLITA